MNHPEGIPNATYIEGKALAAATRARVARQVAVLATEYSVTPGLAVVLVGADPASQVYVRNKRRQTIQAGMYSFEYNMPETTSEESLLQLIEELNADPRVHGILVQLPLPPQIRVAPVLSAIDPSKDVDGFHEVNTGRLWNGGNAVVPCTPMACQMLIEHVRGDDLAGLHAVVIGCSNIVGKPVASLLLRAECTVTMAHIKTRDLPALARTADILVVAVGRAGTVRGDWIKPGATVIDVGINRVECSSSGKQRLVGDVAFAEARKTAGAITPVPGGVGPMTIACLLLNTLGAACRQHGLPVPGDPAAADSPTNGNAARHCAT